MSFKRLTAFILNCLGRLEYRPWLQKYRGASPADGRASYISRLRRMCRLSTDFLVQHILRGTGFVTSDQLLHHDATKFFIIYISFLFTIRADSRELLSFFAAVSRLPQPLFGPERKIPFMSPLNFRLSYFFSSQSTPTRERCYRFSAEGRRSQPLFGHNAWKRNSLHKVNAAPITFPLLQPGSSTKLL